MDAYEGEGEDDYAGEEGKPVVGWGAEVVGVHEEDGSRGNESYDDRTEENEYVLYEL